jgi:DNA-binding LacI/PurR family transcriptional regulator
VAANFLGSKMSVRTTGTRVRIKDVAREAGVSTATVSYVINNTRYVTDATRERVLKAIEKCNYYPNVHARSLALGRSHTLGLLVSDISNPFFPDLVKSIEVAAFERGYDLMLANTNYDAERTSHYVRRMIGRQVAGVLLMTSEIDLGLIDELARRQVSVVFYNLAPARERISNIIVDAEVGIDEAVRHLISLGHRNIAHISGPLRTRAGAQRVEAFRNSMARYLPQAQPPIYEGDFKIEGGRRAAALMLAANERPTAVIVANDMMAFGVMQECRAAGLAIPRDISIIGFDDIAFAAISDPPLTTVRLPRAELGRKAVEALMVTIERPDQPGVELHISTHLVVRGSTAPAPRN